MNVKAFNGLSYDLAPWPVSGHTFSFHSNGFFYLIGGWNPSKGAVETTRYVREVWRWNPVMKTWRKLKSENPPKPLASHSCFEADQKLVIFGGSLSSINVPGNDTEFNSYDLVSEEWRGSGPGSGSIPSADCSHWFGRAIAKYGQGILRHQNTLFVASGIEFGRLVLHKFDLNTKVWTELSSNNGPSGRIRHELVYFEEKLYVFGGAEVFMEFTFSLEQLPFYCLSESRWSMVRTLPDQTAGLPESRMAAVVKLFNNHVYIFGGFHSRFRILEDIWRLDMKTFVWERLPYNLPYPVWFHAGDVSPTGNLCIYSGCIDESYRNRSRCVLSVSLGVERLVTLSLIALVRNYGSILKKVDKDVLTGEVGIPPTLVEFIE